MVAAIAAAAIACVALAAARSAPSAVAQGGDAATTATVPELLPAPESTDYSSAAQALLDGLALNLPAGDTWGPLLAGEATTHAGYRVSRLGVQEDAVFFAFCRWESKWVASAAADDRAGAAEATAGFDSVVAGAPWQEVDGGGLRQHFLAVRSMETAGDINGVRSDLSKSCPDYSRGGQ